MASDICKQDSIEFLRNEILKNDPVAVWLALDGLVTRKPVALSELSVIDVRTLIVVGDQDIALPIQNSLDMFRALKKSEIAVIRNCGHTPMVEQPEEVNVLLHRFLRAG